MSDEIHKKIEWESEEYPRQMMYDKFREMSCQVCDDVDDLIRAQIIPAYLQINRMVRQTFRHEVQCQIRDEIAS